ncbi:hypothetical protein N9146_04215, partial [Akkermansiaceae bacterium]|nr:hypothetical protein [Akkermansiaceae bacterium]
DWSGANAAGLGIFGGNFAAGNGANENLAAVANLGDTATINLEKGLRFWAGTDANFLFIVLEENSEITVKDPSFEINSGGEMSQGGWNNGLGPDWEQRDGANAGGAFEEYISGFVADGTDHVGMQTNYYIWQDTGVAIAPYTTYTLTVAAGNRSGSFSSPGNASTYGLLAGATNLGAQGYANTAAVIADTSLTLAYGSVDASSFDENTFGDVAPLIFTTGASVPNENLVILLGDNSADGRSHFDNIRLDVRSMLSIASLYESRLGEAVIINASRGNGLSNDYNYQWSLNGNPISAAAGGEQPTFSINGLAENEGSWKVVISDSETTYAEKTFEYRIFVDTDGDGLSDYREQNLTNTNFEVVDTDEDGLSDGEEVALGTDPLVADTDEDGFSDSFEAEVLLTDPKISNSVQEFDGMPSGLVAYWPLDSSEGSITRDLGPYGYDLELRNMDSTNFVTIEGRSAVTLDGVEEFLLRESSADDMLPISKNSRFTISMWVKVMGTGQSDTRFFSESSSFNNNPLFNIGTHNYGNNNAIDIYLRDNDSPNHQYSNTEPLDGSWHHIVYTHDDSTQTAQLYVDGVLDRDDWIFKDVDSPEVNLTTIGAILRGTPSNWTNGNVDDVSVWSTVLTPTQITEIFSGSVFISDSLSRLYESNANKKAVVDASSGLSGDPS